MKRIFLLISLFAAWTATQAALRLPALIGDHMVLQQQSQARLWGWATPGSTVRVSASWSEDTYSCKADGDGCWQLSVNTPAASFEAQTLVFTEDGKEDKKDKDSKKGKENKKYKKGKEDGSTVRISDVLIGEVWLASGQSNMEMPLRGFSGCCIENGTTDAINAYRDYPGVRMMVVKLDQKSEVQTDCTGRWTDGKFPNAMAWSATAFYFASTLSQALQVPVGIVNSSYGGATVESWCSKELLDTYPDIDTNLEHIWASQPHYTRPLLMYNAMFAPVRHYTYRGIIWYQGCSNVGVGPSSDEYARRLADMVKLWREQIGLGDIPFHYVEIAPYHYDGIQEGRAAFLREQQYKAQSLIPNSFMISTNDLVEPYELHNIHPRQKKAVGQRLCYGALNRVYGMTDICCSGPRYKDMTARGDTCFIGFTDLQMGICRNTDIRGFEVAGDDRVFYPADDVSLRWQTNHILVRSSRVPHPVAVRYCFRDFQPGTLIGGNEICAYPFRTDDWDK